MTRRVVRLVALVAMCGCLLVSIGWLVTGGRWYVVRTPSMGTAAPVGTLLWVEPVAPAELRVGDIVTFRPPGESGTYSHRIVARSADGTFMTKGDAASPDPWQIKAGDVLGRVELRWWGVGWLIRAAPFLLIGAAASWVLSRPLADNRRRAVLLVGISISVSVALVVLKPLTNVEQLGPGGTGNTDAKANTFISTGLLPVQITMPGREITLRSGQSVTVAATPGRRSNEISVDAQLDWWQWAVLIGACLTPAGVRTMQSASTKRDSGKHRIAAG